MEKYALMASCNRKADVTPAFFCSPDIFVARWRRSSSGLSLPFGFFVPRASKPRASSGRHDHEASLNGLPSRLIPYSIPCVWRGGCSSHQKKSWMFSTPAGMRRSTVGLQCFNFHAEDYKHFQSLYPFAITFLSPTIESDCAFIVPTSWFKCRCFFRCLSSLLEAFQDSFFLLQVLAKPEAETTGTNLTPPLSRVLF